MKENKLLVLNRQPFNTVKRKWVKGLIPDPKAEVCYLEFDRAADRIKYIYVQGKRVNAHGLPKSRLAIIPGTTHIGMMQRTD